MTTNADLFEPNATHVPPTDLASFLPLRAAKSLVGHVHIVDASDATFMDRAYQLRGFAQRPQFKDEWESLAGQVVAAVNGYHDARNAVAKAVCELKAVDVAKLPASVRKSIGKALIVLEEARAR